MKNSIFTFFLFFLSLTAFSQVPTPDFQYFGTPCINDTIQFKNESTNYVDIHWDFGDDLDTWSWESPFHIYTEAAQYSIKLTAYGLTGERRDKVKPIDIFPAPIVNITSYPDSTIMYSGENIEFQAEGNFQTIKWYNTPNIEGETPLGEGNNLTVRQGGFYYAYVVDQYGCKSLVATNEVIILPVDNDPTTVIELQNNIVTANNDLKNDYLYIANSDSYDSPIIIQIYNVWGDIVYSNDNYENNWDGTSNIGRIKGKPLDTGTYYCVINSFHRKGIVAYVDLIR